MGYGNENGFFKSLGPHEISHQWWGHTIGGNPYRAHWMSEGFAEGSASIFLQLIYTEHGLDEYREFWAHQRKILTDTNPQGKRAIDVGPLTLGYRLSTARTGVNITRDLIYPKGLTFFRWCASCSRTTPSRTAMAASKLSCTLSPKPTPAGQPPLKISRPWWKNT